MTDAGKLDKRNNGAKVLWYHVRREKCRFYNFQPGKRRAKMGKKKIGIAVAIAAVLGLGLILYKQMLYGEYVPAADEI